MRTVLYHQSKTSDTQDTFVIDGEVSQYAGAPDQKEVLTIFHSLAQRKNRIRMPFWLNSLPKSDSLSLFFDKNNGLLVMSHFTTKDEAGRKITYSFFTREYKSSFHVAKLMVDYAKMAGMDVNPDDPVVVEKVLQVYNKRYTIISISCAIIILLTTCILCSR